MYDSLGPYYDVIYADWASEHTGEQVAFLRWAFEQCARRPVQDLLDLGAGTGRIAIPLAEAGYRVTALDQSATMLEDLRCKLHASTASLTLCEGRMEDLDCRDQFDALCCVFTTFQHLVGDAEVEQALRVWRDALRSEGVLVFDIINFLDHLGDWRSEALTHHVVGDVRIFRHMTPRIDDVECVCWHEEVCIVDDEGTVRTCSERIPLRIYTAREVQVLLKAANFTDVQVFRGYDDRGDKTGNSARLVFVARKP